MNTLHPWRLSSALPFEGFQSDSASAWVGKSEETREIVSLRHKTAVNARHALRAASRSEYMNTDRNLG